MRCRHCGKRFSSEATSPAFRASCPRCARITKPVLVEKQGDGITSFREIMIAQNAGDPGRKLLETRSHHFTVFLDDRQQVIGFDLMDRDEDHLLKWRQGKPPVYYRVTREGKGYHNHAIVAVNGRFAPAAVIAELQACGHNLRADIRAALLEHVAGAANVGA